MYFIDCTIVLCIKIYLFQFMSVLVYFVAVISKTITSYGGIAFIYFIFNWFVIICIKINYYNVNHCCSNSIITINPFMLLHHSFDTALIIIAISIITIIISFSSIVFADTKIILFLSIVSERQSETNKDISSSNSNRINVRFDTSRKKEVSFKRNRIIQSTHDCSKVTIVGKDSKCDETHWMASKINILNATCTLVSQNNFSSIYKCIVMTMFIFKL